MVAEYATKMEVTAGQWFRGGFVEQVCSVEYQDIESKVC